jgi:hypothetical protein
VPETTREMYDRSVNDLRMPPLDDWDSFPFKGDLRLRGLRPPGPEPVREGEGGGASCSACTKPDSDYAWTNDRWRLADPGPSGLPLIVLLEPREHYDAPSDLPEELAAEMGVMLGRVERAVLQLETVGRVHVGRWGRVARTCTGGFSPVRSASRNCSQASRRSGTPCCRRPPRRSGPRTSPASSTHSADVARGRS